MLACFACVSVLSRVTDGLRTKSPSGPQCASAPIHAWGLVRYRTGTHDAPSSGSRVHRSNSHGSASPSNRPACVRSAAPQRRRGAAAPVRLCDTIVRPSARRHLPSRLGSLPSWRLPPPRLRLRAFAGGPFPLRAATSPHRRQALMEEGDLLAAAAAWAQFSSSLEQMHQQLRGVRACGAGRSHSPTPCA